MFIRPVFISADLFWGFQRYIDLTKYTTIEQVIQFIIGELREFLVRENLQSLIEKLDDRIRTDGFHIENISNYKSLIINTSEPIYVCSH